MAKDPRSLTGKVVAITGGGRGIGRATASALAREGARVAVGDLDREAAERVGAEIGPTGLGLSLDVTDHAAFTAFLDEVEQRLGPLDVLVNNAGIMPVTPFAEESVESVRRQLDINVVGVITGMQLAIERMRPRSAGHIVNLASQAGKGGFPGIATYSGTKHAVVGISEAVRAELRGSGVEIACVMPTVVNTELTSGVGQKMIKPVEASDVADEIVDALEVPRFDVWVPRANGALFKVVALMPRPWREALGRLMKVDKLMTEVDHGARRHYEERAAASEPGIGESEPETAPARQDAA
jgi:NAD(P)-dependent dehydrogenase (short-subunit alcohol dehydrogenase family)